MRINGYAVVRFDVEANPKGPKVETSSYENYEDAVLAMAKAKSRSLGVTCIARNRFGQGRMFLLGLVRP